MCVGLYKDLHLDCRQLGIFPRKYVALLTVLAVTSLFGRSILVTLMGDLQFNVPRWEIRLRHRTTTEQKWEDYSRTTIRYRE